MSYDHITSDTIRKIMIAGAHVARLNGLSAERHVTQVQLDPEATQRRYVAGRPPLRRRGNPDMTRLATLAACLLIASTAPALTACVTTAPTAATIAHRLDQADQVLALARVAVIVLPPDLYAQAATCLNDAQSALEAGRAALAVGDAATADAKLAALLSLAAKVSALVAQVHGQHAALDAKIGEVGAAV